MIKLLRHEFFKVYKSTAVKVGLIVVIAFAIILSLILLMGSRIEISGQFVLENFASLHVIWQIVVAVVVSSIICQDNTKGITRNMILSGYDRYKIYFAKWICATILGLLYFLLFVGIITIFFTINFGWGDQISTVLFVYVFLQLVLQVIAYMTVIVAMALLTNSIGASIGIVVGAYLVFSIVNAFTEFLKGMTKDIIEFVSKLYVGVLTSGVSNFSLSNELVIQYAITACVTIVLFLGISMLKFVKSDFK